MPVLASHLRLALDPVHDSQAVFRVVLEALSRPGERQQVPVAAQDAPSNPWVAAVILTLLDHETTLATCWDEPTDAFVRARTRARYAAVAEVDFVLANGARLTPSLILELRRGSLAYPDESATLVVGVPAGAPTETFRLHGPGIEGSRDVALALRESVVEAFAEANHNYPCGVDVLLIDAAGSLLGLPRTTSIRRPT